MGSRTESESPRWKKFKPPYEPYSKLLEGGYIRDYRLWGLGFWVLGLDSLKGGYLRDYLRDYFWGY